VSGAHQVLLVCFLSLSIWLIQASKFFSIFRLFYGSVLGMKEAQPPIQFAFYTRDPEPSTSSNLIQTSSLFSSLPLTALPVRFQHAQYACFFENPCLSGQSAKRAFGLMNTLHRTPVICSAADCPRAPSVRNLCGMESWKDWQTCAEPLVCCREIVATDLGISWVSFVDG
jgi:hypothetical protein